MTDQILSALNPAQKEAVSWDVSPLLILAGAGSGKTRILTRRIAHLIAQGVPGYQILGITFTNKAANEMKYRVSQLVDQNIWISTFHSTCMRILRMDGPHIDIERNFTIYDDSDQLTLIKESLKELGMNDKQVHPKGVKERINRAKDILMTPYQYAEQAEDMYEESVSKVYKLYEEKLKKLQGLDFGDLIMKTVHLFDTKPNVLQVWQDRFQHILIDEYQDTNHAQYRLVNLLAKAKCQITVVGDPDQSIYGWRGADIQNILNFEKDYPDCGVIRMEQNYRSTQVILDAANELISRNQTRKPKALWTEKGDGEKISLLECENEKAEAEQVVREVLRYQAEGKDLADQVVFYRVHAQSRAIEDALRRHNLPYKIVGGTRFYDRKEIKDLIAYLRILANPNDDVSMKRVINVPARGVGKKAMETIEAFARAKGCSWSEVLSTVGADPSVGPKSSGAHTGAPLQPRVKKSLTAFYAMIERLRSKINDLSVREILEKVLESTGYVEVLESEKSIEAQSRIENIEEFFTVIEDFEESDHVSEIPATTDANAPKPSDLQLFLETISLVTDLDKWDGGTNVLTLMSLHTAKGLEFPVVYITGLEEGIFPHSNSYSDDPLDLEEERRLCYVGITRAKEKLHLLYARERRLYGGFQHNLPSRFLNEIPHELFEASRPPQSSGALRNWYGLSEVKNNDDVVDDVFDDDDFIDISD